MKLTLSYDGNSGDAAPGEVLDAFWSFRDHRAGYPVLTVKVHDPENVGIAENVLRTIAAIVENIEYPSSEAKKSVELEFSRPIEEHSVKGPFLIELTAED